MLLKSSDDILSRNQKNEVEEIYHNIAYNMFIWDDKFIHQIGCQYKPLLELKHKQVIGKKTLLVHHNTEFEALYICFAITTQTGQLTSVFTSEHTLLPSAAHGIKPSSYYCIVGLFELLKFHEFCGCCSFM